MGCKVISLWEEAVPLERNSTTAEAGMKTCWKGWEFGGRGGVDGGVLAGSSVQSGAVGPGQAQKALPSFCVPARPPLFKPSLAPLGTVCFAEQEASFCSRSRWLIHSRALELGRKLVLCCFAY